MNPDNSNTMLGDIFSYHSPKNDQIERYGKIRNTAKSFAYVINDLVPNCADKSAAIAINE